MTTGIAFAARTSPAHAATDASTTRAIAAHGAADPWYFWNSAAPGTPGPWGLSLLGASPFLEFIDEGSARVRLVLRATRIAGSIFAATCLMVAYGTVSATSSGALTPSARGATDPSADTLAKQATTGLQDLGAGWTLYRKAGGFSKGVTKSCNIKFGSPLKISDRGYAGPMFTDASKTVFAYSSSYVFRSEAAAKAYTAARNSSAFTQCEATQDDAAAKKANPKAFVRMAATTSPAVGAPGGVESFYQEEAGAKNTDGTDGTNANYVRIGYRHGRVVYVVMIDVALASDGAGTTVRNERLNQAITGMNAAIEARLIAQGA